jgi:hypothetical protein
MVDKEAGMWNTPFCSSAGFWSDYYPVSWAVLKYDVKRRGRATMHYWQCLVHMPFGPQ